MSDEEQIASDDALAQSFADELTADPVVRDPDTGRYASQDAPEAAAPAEQEESEAEVVTEELDEPEAEDVAPEEASDGDEDEEPETAIDPPLSWTADAKEAFAQLPPDLQQYVAERESDREREINAKLSEAAEVRKKAEAEANETAQERQRYLETLQQVMQWAEQMDPVIAQGRQTDWVELARDEPSEYTALKAEYDQRLQVMQAMQAEYQQVSAQQAEMMARQRKQALSDAFPEFADPATAEAKWSELAPILTDHGISQDEFNSFKSMPHAPYVSLLNELAGHRKAEAARKSAAAKKVTPQAGKTLKPRTADMPKTRPSNVVALEKRAAKTGSLRDEADWIAAELLNGQ